MDFQQSPTGETGILSLGGDWLPTRAQELRETLEHALHLSEHLVVRVQGVSRVSLPFYQLLLAAIRTAREQGKHMSLEGPFPGELVSGARAMGLLTRPGRVEETPPGGFLQEEDRQ